MEKEKLHLFQCLDLTSLNATDNSQTVEKLIDFALKNEQKGYAVASICTFPNFSQIVSQNLVNSNIKTTAVAACFPYSQSFFEVKKLEVKKAIEAGAEEIDIVLNLSAFFEQNYALVKNEIESIKAIAKNHCLKVILETGELKTTKNIRFAAQLAIESGADFIKTSTGKSALGATPVAVQAMCEVIADYFSATNKKIGIKVSGGVRTYEQGKIYAEIVTTVLGKSWLHPGLFRIGASSLAKNLLTTIEK